MAQKVRVLLNGQSGQGAGKARQIESLFAAEGLPCEVTELGAGSNVGRIAHAASKEPETLLVAAGGDGTVSAVACAVARTGGLMGVLPIGTLNHFAKDLKLPLELGAAVRAVSLQNPTQVDAAEVNGCIFVNNSSLGFYPAMVTERERLKKVGWNKWISLSFASIRAFLRFRHIRVRLTLEGRERLCTTPFLFVGNNQYRMQGTQMGTREHLNRGRLYLYLAPGATRMDLLRMTLAALRGRVREVPGYEEFCVSEFTVDALGGRRRGTRVSLDGEIRRMHGPLTYRILPGALCVVGRDTESGLEP